jgi:hypothetical protein
MHRPSHVKSHQDTMGHNENKPAGHSRSAAGSLQACPSGYEKLVFSLPRELKRSI